MKTFLIVATTLDGFIGRDNQDLSTRWTSKEDAAWFSQRTKQAGVCVMGRKTYETFNRPLPDRVVIVQTQDPEAFKTKQARQGVEVELLQAGSPVETLLSRSKTQVWATDLKLDHLHQLLDSNGLKELAICGGSSIYTQWLKAGLVDEFYLTVEPVLFGKGVKLLSEPLDVKLELVSEKKLNERGTRLVEFRVRY